MVSMAEKDTNNNTQSHMVQIVIQICDIVITALTVSVESDSSISCSEWSFHPDGVLENYIEPIKIML